MCTFRDFASRDRRKRWMRLVFKILTVASGGMRKTRSESGIEIQSEERARV